MNDMTPFNTEHSQALFMNIKCSSLTLLLISLDTLGKATYSIVL